MKVGEMKKKLFITGLFVSFLCFSQEHKSKNVSANDKETEKIEVSGSDFPVGTNYSLSEVAIEGAYYKFKQNLLKNNSISIIAEVDYTANARSIEEELNKTRIIFFGNPNLGTPLMQKNQLAGLDLPQKILFYKDENKNIIIIYNSVTYLKSRHNLGGVTTLDKISGALEKLVSGVSKSAILKAEDQIVAEGAGIITKISDRPFDKTYADLKKAISVNTNIRIFAELDHQANAAKVGLVLKPTKIIIFGNPQLGTPLMQESQSIGLDLPMKMLVWENDKGEVFVSYNDSEYIYGRHSVENNQENLHKMSMVLDNLSNAATGN